VPNQQLDNQQLFQATNIMQRQAWQVTGASSLQQLLISAQKPLQIVDRTKSAQELLNPIISFMQPAGWAIASFARTEDVLSVQFVKDKNP